MPTNTLNMVERLITAATGDAYGDGYIVMEVTTEGYAEPGYHTSGPLVFGNWNDKRWARDGEPPVTKAETVPSRLGDALVKAGAEIEWYDEWAQCADCWRAFRTASDSYSWSMFGAFVEDACDYVCADCLRADMESYLPDYVNSPSRILTWARRSDLTGAGFVQWEPGNPQAYESGWHAGQDANPPTILAEIGTALPNSDTVFLLDEASQFYIGFSAWVRPTTGQQSDRLAHTAMEDD